MQTYIAWKVDPWRILTASRTDTGAVFWAVSGASDRRVGNNDPSKYESKNACNCCSGVLLSDWLLCIPSRESEVASSTSEWGNTYFRMFDGSVMSAMIIRGKSLSLIVTSKYWNRLVWCVATNINCNLKCEINKKKNIEI